MKKYLLASAGAFLIPVMAWAMSQPLPVLTDACESLGGRLQFQQGMDGGGLCVFSDGMACREAALMNGQCGEADRQPIINHGENLREPVSMDRLSYGYDEEHGTEILESPDRRPRDEDDRDENGENLQQELYRVEKMIQDLQVRREEILKQMAAQNLRPVPRPQPVVRDCSQEMYNPVCALVPPRCEGCDPIAETFSNRCEADRYGIDEASLREGECDTSERLSDEARCEKFPGPDDCDGSSFPVLTGKNDEGCDMWDCQNDEREGRDMFMLEHEEMMDTGAGESRVEKNGELTPRSAAEAPMRTWTRWFRWFH